MNTQEDDRQRSIISVEEIPPEVKPATRYTMTAHLIDASGLTESTRESIEAAWGGGEWKPATMGGHDGEVYLTDDGFRVFASKLPVRDFPRVATASIDGKYRRQVSTASIVDAPVASQLNAKEEEDYKIDYEKTTID